MAEVIALAGEEPHAGPTELRRNGEGLAFAHDAGVAHTDLQPYLVLVSPQGQVRLMGAAVAMSVAQGLVGLVMIVIYRRNFGIGLLQIIFPQGEDFSTLWNFLSSKFRRRSAIHPEAA